MLEEGRMETGEPLERGEAQVEQKGYGKCAYQKLFDGRLYTVISHVTPEGKEIPLYCEVVPSLAILEKNMDEADKQLIALGKDTPQRVDYSFKSEEEYKEIARAYKQEEPPKEKGRYLGFGKWEGDEKTV